MSRKQDINAMDSALQGGDAGFVNSDAQRRSNADWTKQQSLRGSSPRNRKNRLNVAAGSAIQSGLGAATGAGLAGALSGSKRAMTIGALGGAATGLATGYQAGKRVNAKQTQLGSVLRAKQRGDIKLSRNGVNPLTGINKSTERLAITAGKSAFKVIPKKKYTIPSLGNAKDKLKNRWTTENKDSYGRVILSPKKISGDTIYSSTRKVSNQAKEDAKTAGIIAVPGAIGTGAIVYNKKRDKVSKATKEEHKKVWLYNRDFLPSKNGAENVYRNRAIADKAYRKRFLSNTGIGTSIGAATGAGISLATHRNPLIGATNGALLGFVGGAETASIKALYDMQRHPNYKKAKVSKSAFGVVHNDISKGKIAYAAKRIINSREIALSSSKKARQHYDASEKAFKAIRTGKGQPEGLSNAYMSNRGLASKYNKEANMARKVTNMKTIRPSRKLPDTNVFPKTKTI
jgi:hypothetical protein